MKRVSFIVPSYNEVENVTHFYERFASVFNSSPFDWELVFVDDGSGDNTYQALCALAETKPHILAIRLSRNFGKEAAIWAGLKNASGDYIGIIDADLQQTPEDALAMTEFLDSHDEYDCVAAYQENRLEKGLIKALKNGFYRVMSKVSGMNLLDNASDFRVFHRYVAEAILSMPENFRFSKGIFAWIGFNTYAYPYSPNEREAGTSKWSLWKLISYAINGMLSFSVAPLRLALLLGFVTSVLAIIYFVIILVQTLVMGIDVPGYATTIGVVLLLGGIQLFVVGIVGEYVARTYIQGKHRPIYIEKSRVSSLDTRSFCSSIQNISEEVKCDKTTR